MYSLNMYNIGLFVLKKLYIYTDIYVIRQVYIEMLKYNSIVFKLSMMGLLFFILRNK